MILNCSQEMHNIGYAWRGLKEQLGEEIDEHIKRMTFLKGKMVCIINVLLKSRHHLVLFNQDNTPLQYWCLLRWIAKTYD